jgi:hypothetical protein
MMEEERKKPDIINAIADIAPGLLELDEISILDISR